VSAIYFDQSSADKVLAFVRLLTLTKCTASGRPEPFEPLPWFQKLIGNVYGWRKPDGTRLTRRVFASMARKNAKTQCIAALALAEFLGIEEENQPEVYMAAKSVEQAGYCFAAARDMIRADADLEACCKITDSTKEIKNSINGGVLKVLSAEGKSKHGSNPSCVIFDELHAWSGIEQELYDALTSGSLARRQPLFLMITTAGSNIETICGREYQYAKRVLDGTAEDPTYFPLIYELPADADWTVEANWPMANPGLGVTVRLDSLRDEVKTALARPAEQNRVRRLNFNQWTETSEVWIPPMEWDACQGAPDFEALRNEPCYGGLDLASTRDLTAFSLVWPQDDRITSKTWFFIPEDGIAERSIRDGVKYDLWSREGHVVTTPGAVTDWRYVTQFVKNLAAEYNVQAIAFDRYGARDTAGELQEDGLSVMDFGQGYLSMSAPSKRLEALVYERKIMHDGNPAMRWNFSCCSTSEDAAQNIKPVKAKGSASNQRIDGVVSLVMALGVAQKQEPVVEVGVMAI
jgi:phage terminase large subunit-like protein